MRPLASDFGAGVFWIELAPVRDPGLVVDTIAQTLGAKQELAAHIGDKQLLLVLDNLEQVVESAVELVFGQVRLSVGGVPSRQLSSRLAPIPGAVL